MNVKSSLTGFDSDLSESWRSQSVGHEVGAQSCLIRTRGGAIVPLLHVQRGQEYCIRPIP